MHKCCLLQMLLTERSRRYLVQHGTHIQLASILHKHSHKCVDVPASDLCVSKRSIYCWHKAASVPCGRITSNIYYTFWVYGSSCLLCLSCIQRTTSISLNEKIGKIYTMHKQIPVLGNCICDILHDYFKFTWPWCIQASSLSTSGQLSNHSDPHRSDQNLIRCTMLP